MGVAPDDAGLAARRAALSGAEIAALFPKLVRFARACGVRAADAEDVAQTALTKFWAGDRVWDRATHPDVPLFLMGIVRSVAYNEQGVTKPAEQAARLRRSPKEIYDAGDRIQRHVRRIAKGLPPISDEDEGGAEDAEEEDEVAE